ncbi:MAG: cytochrome c family protein [Rhodobacteraceae bacterium]|nr:cytochrome c family protein [Paracoccaceae bacterium]
MFDTITFTKLLGAFCGALLVFTLVRLAGAGLYSTPELAAPAYVILEEEGDTPTAEEPAEELTFEELLAAADPDAGQRTFKACAACHKVEEGVNAVGPSLYQVVGRGVAVIPDFKYSGALDGTGDVWTPEAINAFITNPKAYAPGTAMSYAGLKKAEDRANVIAYLQTLGM